MKNAPKLFVEANHAKKFWRSHLLRVSGLWKCTLAGCPLIPYLESDKPLHITPSLISSRAHQLNDAAASFISRHLGIVSIISCKFLFHFSPQGLFDCSISHEGFALFEKAYHSAFSIVNNAEKAYVAAKAVVESKSVSVGSETWKTYESKPLDLKSFAPNPHLAGQGKIVLKMKKRAREASESDVSADLDLVVADEGSIEFVGCQMSKLLCTKKKRSKHSRLHTPLALELQTIFEKVEEGVVSSQVVDLDLAQVQMPVQASATLQQMWVLLAVLSDSIFLFLSHLLIFESLPPIAPSSSPIPPPTIRQPINYENEDHTSFLNTFEISTIKERAKRAAKETKKQTGSISLGLQIGGVSIFHQDGHKLTEQDSMSDPSVMGVVLPALLTEQYRRQVASLYFELKKYIIIAMSSLVEAFNLFRETFASELDSALSAQRLEYEKKILNQRSQHARSALIVSADQFANMPLLPHKFNVSNLLTEVLLDSQKTLKDLRSASVEAQASLLQDSTTRRSA
ncbi:hypothetical protein TIFTF001_022995 [Ficus carica]|uniref:Uncharacterized protein n=1 Tax=Ficus carica TaxID=3494 RepID=A0AA88DK37_FICCA|nr:hypothetical protein TIFTF001_022995 [Ficus carica]